MFENYFRELQQSPRWGRLSNLVIDVCAVLGAVLLLVIFTYLLKVWFFG